MRKIRPARIEGDVAYIPLTKGYEAIIDLADLPLVENWSWCASSSSPGRPPYAVRRGDGRGKISMHRQILGFPDGEVDHRDMNRLNNRRSNLRQCGRSENSHNGLVRKHNKLGIKGVSEYRQRFRAVIRKDDKRHHLGTFDTPEEAAAAYAKAARELFGEFARTD